MNSLRQYIQLALVLILLFSLFDCGDEDKELFVEVKSQDHGGSAYVGDLVINDDKDIEKFSLGKYKIVTGDIILEGPIQNIEGLSNLEQIKGDLIINNTEITNLDGFRNLKMVLGKIEITNNKWLGYYAFNYCGIQNLFKNPEVNLSLVVIRDNAPTYMVIIDSADDIIKLNCGSSN